MKSLINRILCPTDLSPLSRHAFLYALALAEAFGARVRVLEIIDTALPPMAPGSWGGSRLTAEMRRPYLKDLETFVGNRRQDGRNLDVVLSEGHVADEILRQAEMMPADLIVMGTHRRRAIDRWVLGSVTEKIFRKARCPILAVPSGRRRLSHRGFGVVVCGVDLVLSTSRMIAYIASLIRPAGRLVLIHSIALRFDGAHKRPVPRELKALQRRFEDHARRWLHAIVGNGQRSDIEIDAVVAYGKPHVEILRCARDTSADLIVMGPHDHGTWGVIPLGSTTQHVLRAAPCPVLSLGQRSDVTWPADESTPTIPGRTSGGRVRAAHARRAIAMASALDAPVD